MNTTARELFRREELLAERYRTRKLDILFQSLQCPHCGAEGIRRRRFHRRWFDSVEEIERLMHAQMTARFDAECSNCGASELHGAGSRHFFLLYSEQLAAHLVISMKLERQEDERVRVRQRMWFVEKGGEGKSISEDDPRLPAFWRESRLRFLLNNPDEHDIEDAIAAFSRDEQFRPIVLREYAELLIEEGGAREALDLLDNALTAEPNQPELLVQAARLNRTYQNYDRATDLFIEAWEQHDDPELLADVVLSSYHARRFGLMQMASGELLNHERHAVAAAKALATLGSAVNIDDMRFGWKQLRDRAREEGDRVAAQVASCQVQSLELPIPDWPADLDSSEYAALIREALEEEDFEVEEDPRVLTWGDAQMETDLVVRDVFGATYAFVLCDVRPSAAVTRSLIARARAMLLDPEFGGARGILLTRETFPYSLYRYFSDLPDAQLDLSLDADTTLNVHEENIATLLWAAEKYFGALLDFSLDSVEEVDRILLRFHDDGFGALEHPLACIVASYVREVLQREVGPCDWVAGDPPMDPRVLLLPNGGKSNLLSRIHRVASHGREASLYDLVRALIELVKDVEPEEEP